MQVKLEKQPKSTFKLEVVVPVAKVKEMYAKVLAEMAKNAQLAGFRKGQAPVSLVEEKANKSELYGEVVNKLLEVFYPQAVKENNLAPISNPKVEIKEFEPTKDFEFVATIATNPELKIKEYKKLLKKRFEEIKDAHKEHDHAVHLTPDEVVKILIDLTEIEIADLLIEEEINRMFSRMVQQIQAMGMSVEDFLKSQNKTVEQLSSEYKKNAEESLKAEFIFAHLIKEENLVITDNEIEEMIAAVGDKGMMEKLKSPVQKVYIKSIIAKNRLLTKLIEEAEGVKVDDLDREENQNEK
ncbi:hypothetical protein HYV31_01515 [candidate division WWE3 bacterium]|nr:hypothetical protein [candidate division WWE3 bacterium]